MLYSFYLLRIKQTSAYKEIASRVLEKLPPNSDPFPVQEPAR